MSLPNPPNVLKNFFGGYPLALWNYLALLVSKLATSTPTVFTGQTPGLMAGETITFNLPPLQNGKAYDISWEAICIGPGPVRDAMVFALASGAPRLAFTQDGGNLTAVPQTGVIGMPHPLSTGVVWTMTVAIAGGGGAQFLQWTFTDVGSTEVVNVMLSVSVSEATGP